MTEDIENLILEHLRRLREGQDRMQQDIGDLKFRLGAVERGIAAVQETVATKAHASIASSSAWNGSKNGSIWSRFEGWAIVGLIRGSMKLRIAR